MDGEWSDMSGGYIPYVSPNLIIVPTTSFVNNEIQNLSEKKVTSENVQTKYVEPIGNPNLVQIIPDVKIDAHAPGTSDLEGKSSEKPIVIQTLEQNNNYAPLKTEGNTIITSEKKPTLPTIEINENYMPLEIKDNFNNPLDKKPTFLTTQTKDKINNNALSKPEGAISPSEKKPLDLRVEQNRETIQPKILQTPKHSAALEKAKLMKSNSWASNYLQSIGQNRISPLKNSPASENKTMPDNDRTSTQGKIKINFLPPTEKEIKTNPPSSTGFLPRMDTITWFTQFASSPNIKLDYKTDEPQPKIHITQVQPKSDSGTVVANKGVLPHEKLGDTSHKTNTSINPILHNLDQLQSAQNYSSDTIDKYNVQPGTPSSGNITKEAQWSKNHYDCLDRIFTDIKNPQNKHIDMSPKRVRSQSADQSPDTRYTKIASTQNYSHETKADSQSKKNRFDIESNKEVRSYMIRHTELKNRSIYYKDKFEAKFSKTKGLEQLQNDRKRREINTHHDNKKRKLSRDSQRANRKRNCSSDKKSSSNDKPERTQDKRKRVTDSENDYNSHSEAKKAKHSLEIPQEKQDRQDSPSTNGPPKSVVTAENIPKHPRIQHPVSTSSDEEEEPVYFDLRSKLKNKNSFYTKTINKFGQTFQKPRDNLRITINRSDEEISNKDEIVSKNDAEFSKNNPIINQSNDENHNNNPTLENESIPKQKRKNYKQIKLIINVLCKDKEDSSDSSSSDDSSSDQKINTTRSDLSFLDDFNIDEIVNSLSRTPKQNAYPKINELSKAKNTKVVKNLNKIWSRKKFVQPIIIKKEVKLENVEKEQQSVVTPENINCEASKDQSEVPVASEIQSAPVNNKAEEKCDMNSNHQNDLLKDKQSINEQIDVINKVKQENSVDECPNIDNETNENTVHIPLEDSTVLANIEDLKREKPDAHNPITDIVQHNAILINTEACISVPTKNPDTTLQSHENNTGNTNQNEDSNRSEINKDDVEIINDNVFVIDLTINEPEEICNINKLPEEQHTKEGNKIKSEKEDDSQEISHKMNVCNENETYKIKLSNEEHANKEDKKINTEKEHDSQDISHEINVFNENNIYKMGTPGEECVSKEANNKIKTEKECDSQEKSHEVNVCNENEINKIGLPGEEYINKKDNNIIKTVKEYDSPEKNHEINDCNENEIQNIELPGDECTNKQDNNKITIGKESQDNNSPKEIHTHYLNSEVKSGQDVTNEKDMEIGEPKESTSGKEICISNNTLETQNLCTNNRKEYEIKRAAIGVEEKSAEEKHEINVPKQVEDKIKALNNTKENNKTMSEENCTKEKNNNEVESDAQICSNNGKIKSGKEVMEEKTQEISLPIAASVNKKTNNKITTTLENCIPKDSENPTTSENNNADDLNIDKVLQTQIENRIFDYLHKRMTVTSMISQGKFSTVYKCKEADGECYALKVTKYSRVSLGIEKEDMIFNFQKDIPKENLSTVFLINGFGVYRSWCFLMEYYPFNLSEAMLNMTTPYHIDKVQHLSRQLVSAVMLLRTYNIIHSDIKPRHVLLDATHERLKLCGFDQSYYTHTMIDLVPNIGTHVYRAPEIIIGYSASFSIDVWSTATVIYEMATKKKLFNGGFNNDVLFQQLCLSGDMPKDIIDNSLYACNHFSDSYFMRRFGHKGQNIEYLCNFDKTNRVIKEMMKTYNRIWGPTSQANRPKDVAKIVALTKLLTQMLIIDPRERINIEFVCSDPFVYETFNI